MATPLAVADDRPWATPAVPRSRAGRIRSAARSAIMITGAFVLPRVIVRHHRGVDDPQALEPEDAQLGVDDRAHRAGRGRVIDALRRRGG